ncbi:MAG: tetratricopeptide repeat protein [Gammaproteobacteria bacterium]
MELGGAGVTPVEVDLQNFQTEVLEKSQAMPVLAEFYAEGAEPSDAMRALLDAVLGAYAGKLQWARIDVQRNPQIVQQLGVRGLPTVKIIHEGQLAGNLEGPQTESSVREVLDPLFLSPLEQIQGHLAAMIEAGDFEGAIGALRQMIQQEPNNPSLFVELADLLVLAGDLAEAESILNGLAKDAPGRSKADQRLLVAKKAESLPEPSALQTKVEDAETKEDRMAARLDLAYALAAQRDVESALNVLLENIREDRAWRDEESRQIMVGMFELFEKGHPIPSTYRRKLFTLMH